MRIRGHRNIDRHGLTVGQMPIREVIGRLVIPLAGAEALRDLLIDYLAKAKRQGASQASPPKTVQ
jgi:hypothetical protein